MTSPLRLDQIVECADQLPTRGEQGGTEDRRPILRGGVDCWLIDGYEALMAATEEACGIGSRRVLGPKP